VKPIPTKSELKALLAEKGFSPRRRLGQNFLVDHNMLRFIARTAALGQADLVLEIGAGTGMFTGLLASQAGHVVAVEVDAGLAGICSGHVADRPNVEVITADILESKSTLSPQVLSRCRALSKSSELTTFKVVSNLPYVVATPVVLNLLESDLNIDLMVVLVQEEIAAKFAAEVDTPEYGVPGVLAQVHGNVEVVRRLSPRLFWPEPEVTSALVKITPAGHTLFPPGRYDRFKAFVKTLFFHRRKTILKILSQKDAAGRGGIETALDKLGIKSKSRPQELSVRKLAELSKEISDCGFRIAD
jgi:16S rRNA (adenine1518-N6/adenine1519-N6)-dimethyltransferase